MQRVLLRNILARNRALKRQRQQSEDTLREEAREVRRDKVTAARSERSRVKAERTHRREDWMLGPLAPNRLAGKDGDGYGMIDILHTHGPPVMKRDREKYVNIVVNDRVVVVSGREKGKIGKVGAVDEKTQAITVYNINLVDVKLPPFMRQRHLSKAPFGAYPAQLPLKDVRLVVPLRDNTTGEIRDTVIKHLKSGGPFSVPAYGSNTPKHTRYIAGPNIPIPWPKAEVKEMKAEAADTLRIDVDDVSFLPSLQYIPMPVSLIDELRNKYGRQRQDQRQEYVQQKMREDAQEHWEKQRRMLLPQQEYREQKLKQKKAIEETGVTEETMNLIKATQAANLINVSERINGQAS